MPLSAINIIHTYYVLYSPRYVFQFSYIFFSGKKPERERQKERQRKREDKRKKE